MSRKPNKKNTSLAAFCRALKKHDHFLVSCHVTPEGDAIGSLFAMESLLRRLGKKTTVVCEDPFPKRLAFLSSKRWNRAEDIRKPAFSFQALVTTDCPTLDRIGKVRSLLTPETVIFNIDHHVSNHFFGNYNYVRPEASATGEVVFDIFKHLRLPLTKWEAENIYTAIVTDTGSFKYSNTSEHCHKIAAELIRTGIPVEKINDAIYSTYSLRKIQLYSRLLSRVKTSAHGQIAWAGLKRSDLKHSGATYEDAEGFIDFLKYLKEVKIAFFMTELENNGRIRVSFRSKGNYDVNRIATFLGGGGHRKASGCILRGSLDGAKKKILKLLSRKLNLK